MQQSTAAPDVAKLQAAGCGQEPKHVPLVVSHVAASSPPPPVLASWDAAAPGASATTPATTEVAVSEKVAATIVPDECVTPAAADGCNEKPGWSWEERAAQLAVVDSSGEIHTGKPPPTPLSDQLSDHSPEVESCLLLAEVAERIRTGRAVQVTESKRHDLLPGHNSRSISCQVPNRPPDSFSPYGEAAAAGTAAQFGRHAEAAEHCELGSLPTRPVRIRKAPRTYISEMEKMDDGPGASKRRKRAIAESDAGGGGTVMNVEQPCSHAQVLLDSSYQKNADNGAPSVSAGAGHTSHSSPSSSTTTSTSTTASPVGCKGKAATDRRRSQASGLSHAAETQAQAIYSSNGVSQAELANSAGWGGNSSSNVDSDLQALHGRLTRSRLSKTRVDCEATASNDSANHGKPGADSSDDEDHGSSSTDRNAQTGGTPKKSTANPTGSERPRPHKRKWRNQYGSSEDATSDIGQARSASSTPALSTMDVTPVAANERPDIDLGIGDFVWGKMRGFDWWPGSIVSAGRANQVSTTPGHTWVCWFGDNQFSQILLTRIRPLTDFRQYLLRRKPKSLYRRAIIECADSAALRANKQFPSEWPGTATVSTEDQSVLDNFCDTPRQRHVLHWALGEFVPEGLDGLRPSELDINNAKRSASGQTLPSSPDGPLSPPYSTSPIGSSPLPSTPRSSTAASRSLSNSVMVTPRQPQQMVQSDTRGSSGQQLERFALLRQGKVSLSNCCLCCGASGECVQQEHPLFAGGICDACVPAFIECAYCFDEDGSQTYCCICADGKEVYLCDSPGCARSYCPLCIEKLCGADIHRHINKLDSWMCFMCDDQPSDQLEVRDDWHARLLTLMSSEDSGLYQLEPTPPPPAPEDRQAIRVLGLFDGIATGMIVLNELGIEVAAYTSSEIDADAVRVSRRHHTNIVHVGAVEEITSQRLKEWGPFDLVIGGSPCNDLSMANPARRGIFEGTGRLFFDFFRLLQLAKPAPSEQRPFFWLFENVVSMRAVDKATISRFLECNPSVVDAKDVSPAHRPRYFWGNLPGMMRGIVPWPGDVLSLQDCVEPNCGRRAKFEKLRTITTKTNSIRQTKQNLFPVSVERRGINGSLEGEDGDMLWCTEMERIFGFPAHYTDVGNMGRVARQRLLGRAWSTPVIRHLLAPLRDYFKTTGKQLPVQQK